ncbi:hypothetical protein [Nostoc sp. UHCC 0252]|uniref:hypothetical protein n=1 Tax=Nostoc sp. UHCC 0252 TaxID=3110241 RepID=UPI002B210199|nr:hypothetical protein [Nostoc sp. UHCC 0252]MEA5606469.1 hypothetical protein [Nostoc sp. UHCC 0252]
MVKIQLANSLSCAFWLQRIKPFRWSTLTTIQTCLQADALLMDALLDGYQIRLLVVPPFHPALRIDD